MNSVVKWKGEEQYQNPQHTVGEKFKECIDMHKA